MKLDVLNIKGESTGRSVELPADIFSVEPNEHAVYLAVKQYNAAQRQGTHKAKAVSYTHFDAPKTKSYAQALNSLGAGGKKSVLVLSEDNTGVYLSSRNIQGANVTVFNSLNTYEIMNANVVLIAENAVSKMGEAFAK